MAGQIVYLNNTAYKDGAINVKKLSAGEYILKIQSDNGRYKFIKRFIKY